MNCTSGVFKFTKSWFCTCKSSKTFPYPVGRTASKYFFNFFLFSSKNFLPTPDSISSSSIQNLEEDLPLLTNVFHVTSRNRGSFLKQEREPWERDWVTTGLPRIPRPVFMLFARGTSISFKQWRQSGANLGIVALAKIQLPRCSLSPPSKSWSLCLFIRKQN